MSSGRGSRAALLVVLGAAAATAHAGGAGTAGAPVFRISAGARPEGMGGAYAAVADDLNALFWNPAGLAAVRTPEAAALSSLYVARTSFHVLGYAQPVGGVGTFAGAASLMDYGSLLRTVATSDGLYGGTNGSVSAMDLFGTGGWGRRFVSSAAAGALDAGAGLSVASLGGGGTARTAVGLTAGALWHLPVPGVAMAAVADHLGAVSGGFGPLGATWRLGAAWDARPAPPVRTLLALDAGITPEAGVAMHAGFETVIADLAAVRAGWRGGGASSGGPTFGAGFFIPGAWLHAPLVMRVDYAGGSMEDLGFTHRVQLVIRFGANATPDHPHGYKFVRDLGQRCLVWDGGRPPFTATARSAETGETVALALAPGESRRILLGDLASGVWQVTVRGEPEDTTAWQGGGSSTVKVTVPVLKAKPAVPEAPSPVAPAAPASHTLAPPTALHLARGATGSLLAWDGAGPAYLVLMIEEGTGQERALTPVPVMATEVALPKLAPGVYFLRVRAVDPADPAAGPADSAPMRISVKPKKR